MKIHAALAALAGLSVLAYSQTTPTMKQKAPKQESQVKAAPAGGKSAYDKPTFEAYVRHLLLWSPQIGVSIADPKPAPMPGYKEIKVTGTAGTVSLDELFYVSNDGKKIVRGTVYDIAESPFKQATELLKTDLQPSIGTAGAPVVIVLFSDFQCAYCRQEAKMLREHLVKTYPNEVRLYFKDFPLDQIHPWARSASIAGRCVFRQNPLSFWDYHDWIFDKQAEIRPDNLKSKVMEWAQSKGLDSMQLGRCFDNRSPEAEINKSIAEAREVKVTSTPTMFVNGRQIPGSIDWAQLKQVIDWELDYSKKTATGGEQCCELTLPTPLKR